MLNKVLIGIGATGIATGASIGGYYYHLSKQEKEVSIKELLTQKGITKTHLTNSNKSESKWLQKWKNYVTDNSENSKAKAQDTWNISSWNSINTSLNSVPEAFANACESQLNNTKVKNTSETKYTNYIKWCTE